MCMQTNTDMAQRNLLARHHLGYQHRHGHFPSRIPLIRAQTQSEKAADGTRTVPLGHQQAVLDADQMQHVAKSTCARVQVEGGAAARSVWTPGSS